MTQSRDTGEVLNTRGTMGIVDAQTSSTDATSGRGLLVGAFGIGGQVTTTTELDLDNLLFGSVVRTQPSNTGGISNYPPQVSGLGGRGIVSTFGDAGYMYQTYVAAQENNIFFRSLKAGSPWSDWQPVYTGADYQPETVDGLGIVSFRKNVSGGTVADNAAVAGPGLQQFLVETTGSVDSSGLALSGTYKNVTGIPISNNRGGLFVKVSN